MIFRTGLLYLIFRHLLRKDLAMSCCDDLDVTPTTVTITPYDPSSPCSQATPAQDLVNLIDAAHGKAWQVYRTMDDRWVVQLGTESVTANTLDEALLAAACFRPLPRIPRKPQLVSIDGFTARKSGSYWTLEYKGQFWIGNLKTKTEAMDFAAKAVARQNEAVNRWVEQYGRLVATGTEGTDYRFEY